MVCYLGTLRGLVSNAEEQTKSAIIIFMRRKRLDQR